MLTIGYEKWLNRRFIIVMDVPVLTTVVFSMYVGYRRVDCNQIFNALIWTCVVVGSVGCCGMNSINL